MSNETNSAVTPPRLPIANWLTWVAVAVALLGLGGLAVYQRVVRPAPQLEIYGEVPPFQFLNERGEPMTRDNFLGTLWVADFIFTRCGGQCPRMTASMVELQKWLNQERIEDVRLFSLSVDPEYDTTTTLQEYALRFNYDPWRWSFLTGDKPTIYRFIREGFKLGLEDAPPPGTAPENEPIIHSSRFVLVDRKGQIRGYFDGLDPEEMKKLREAIRILRREKN
ncbi:MAG: SCO family protein [Candidatus Sumerlaea chitinivorans]|uniref:Cytochrome oxidase biogenesis protein Sco1/SenC/PrrC, putative copper metallochaperone n=1 Tax=Sumerlaea chitinivorans TaxID=2250252 RepID=A0A2Z4YA40_SUMC1|nr:Cytochrome oxidase biogenesis protein Sco1/SenC/PrrC, putative copper metallochaperone [Candidatus Sumerlaea chitinivorans]MCX7963426.1 SCO family protein [Candidatus Sumerlaea chitinivorans]